ncbi:MAG TPA: YhjD/YihY/BrkB family envelope integrity protein [Actinomycetota bacterium]|nr:YhjD/YihY/BrkB family envelope integrity protein [Actinomycetota bacterium]
MDEQTPRRDRIAEAKERVDRLKASAEARLATERQRRSWVRLAVRAWERDRDRAGGLLAGGLAYRIFLWQLPTALVIVAIGGLFADMGDTDPGVVMEEAGLTAAVASAMGQVARDAGTSAWWLLLFGLWGMLWAGRGAARALKVVSAIAYETRPSGGSATRGSLVFNGLMLATMFLQLLSGSLLGDSLVGELALIVLIAVVTFAIVTWALTLLPRGERPWTVVLPGSILFALAILATRLAIDVYFADRVHRVEDIYGSIGIAIVILLALYLVARVLLWSTFLSSTFAGVGSGGEAFDVRGVFDAYAHPVKDEPDAGAGDGTAPGG